MAEGPSVGQCRDWTGNSSADLTVSCNSLGGTFSASAPCPAESRVASCTVGPTLGTYATYRYYAPEYTLEDAQTDCTNDLEGTFEPQ